MFSCFYNYWFTDLFSFAVWLTIFNSLFIACSLRPCHTLLFYFLFAFRKSRIFSNFNFIRKRASFLVFISSCEVLSAYNYFLYCISYDFFSCLFNFTSFWVVLVNDSCFYLTWGKCTSFNYSLVFGIIVNIFDFYFNIFRIVVFWCFDFCSNFNNVFYRIFSVGFSLCHFTNNFSILKVLFVFYIIRTLNTLLYFIACASWKFIIVSNFNFKWYFESFFVFYFAWKICWAYFDNSIDRFFFSNLLFILNFWIYYRPFSFPRAQLYFLFNSVNSLVSPFAFFKFWIYFNLSFKW